MSTQVINNYLYLMDKSDLASYPNISANIDPARVNPCIRDAQDMDLQLFMGDAFWYDFISQFDLTGFLTAGIINPVTTQADGNYLNVAIGGSGTGGFATIVVLGSKVTSIVQTVPGIGYVIGDAFSWNGATFNIIGLCGVLPSSTPQLIKDLFLGTVYNDFAGNPVKYDGIIPALVYWTFARFIEVDQIRYTTTGPVQKNHDASEPASLKQITQLVEMQRSKANAYANKIEKFLYINKSSFPLWRINQENKNSRQPGARIRAIDKTRYNRGGYGSWGYGWDDFGQIL
jgi:hypothetical protein